MNPSRRIGVRYYERTDQRAWDQYVQNHSHATLYHLSGWKNVIEKTCGHKTYSLMAVNDNQKLATRNSQQENTYGLSAIRKYPTNSTNPKNSMNSTNSINPSNPTNPNNYGTQATVVTQVTQ